MPLKFKNSDVVLHHDDYFNTEMMLDLAKSKNAKYLGEFCIKDSHGWLNGPAAIFYSEVKHPEGSNYFALYQCPVRKQLYITDGITATYHTWGGVYDKDTKEGVYSCFRHDYQTFENLMADGGPEYLRRSLEGEHLRFKIEDGELIVL